MDVKKFVSKPVEAVIFDGTNGAAVSDWISESSTVGRAIFQGERIYVPTLSGTKIGGIGDVIVRDSVGDFACYSPDEFASRYEEAP